MHAVFNILLPIFSLILIGFICRRTGCLGETAASELNRFVVWLCLPALLFLTTATSSVQQIWHPGFILATTLATLIVFSATLMVQLKHTRKLADASIDGLSAAYANTGYIGIPLCLLVFGKEGLQPALIATLIVVCVLFALAVVCIEIGLQNEPSTIKAIRKVIIALSKNPLVISPILGVAWNISNVTMPYALTQFLHTLGEATTPCALVSLGLFLAEPRQGSATRSAIKLTAIKLILHPLVTWLLAYYVFKLPPLWTKAALLLSALPTGTGPFMLAEFYRRETPIVSQTVLLSTLGSLITLSLCMQI